MTRLSPGSIVSCFRVLHSTKREGSNLLYLSECLGCGSKAFRRACDMRKCSRGCPKCAAIQRVAENGRLGVRNAYVAHVFLCGELVGTIDVERAGQALTITNIPNTIGIRLVLEPKGARNVTK